MKIFTFPIRCIYFFPLPYLLYLALRVIRLKAMRAACLCGRCFSPFVFYLCISAKNAQIILVFFCGCFSSVSYASPPPSNDVHFCKIIDYEEIWARNSRYAATKQALNLNVGEPRTVRMIYFLPNDRPFQQEVVDSMKVTIRQIQTFYADQMEAHGHGRKTFRFETDSQGEPVVHRVDGQHPSDYYNSILRRTEIEQKFDTSTNNIYLALYVTWGRATGGGGKNGGYAQIGGRRWNWGTVAHELGHAFGMNWHDWRDGDYIMSYGAGGGRNRLSECAAEFLSVHPFFNPDIPDEETPPPTIELISSPEYPTGSTSVSIRLKVSDPDGLHQVILFNNPGAAGNGIGVKMCKGLNGETEAVVEFDYDGVIPNSSDPYGTGTSLSDPLIHPIYVRAVDVEGNVSNSEYFIVFDDSLQGNIIATLQSHTDEVFSVSFSPDGTTLASGSADGTIKLWDVAKRQNIATLEGHTSWITSIAFSPDGKTLASGSGYSLNLWDVATGTNIATLDRSSQSVSFSPDGTILASGYFGGAVKLWDVATRTSIATLEGHSYSVNSVSFSPDGTVLASGSLDDTVKLWDVATRTNIATIAGHKGGINSVSFSPDGKTLASGSYDGSVKLWDVATRTNIATIAGHKGGINSVSFSPDGKTLASGSYDGSVKLWDVATRTNIATIAGHKGGINSVSFSPDGTTLASGSYDGTVKLWDTSTSEWLQPRPQTLLKISGDNQQGTPSALLANPLVVEVQDQNGDVFEGAQVTFTVIEGDGRLNGRFTVENTTTDANGRVEMTLTLGPNQGTNSIEASLGLKQVTFNAEGVGSPPIMGGDYRTWHLPDGAIARLGKGSISERDRAVAFSPDGQLLAVASGIGIWLYDVATSRELALLTGHTRPVTLVVFSPDGTTLASGSRDATIKLWDVATNTKIATLEGFVFSVAFSPDGTTLASGGRKTVKLWDVTTSANTATLTGHTDLVNSVAFSPDGTMLASAGSRDATIKLWDVATNTNTATLEGHAWEITSMAFSPDGKTLASASDDRTVKLWDVAKKANTATLTGHTAWVNSVSFSPDGATLASVGSKTVKLWDVTTSTSTANLEGHTAEIISVAFSPDGKTLASAGSRDATIKLWDVATQNTATLEGHTNGVNSVAFSPDGKTLASAESWDTTIKLWDVTTSTNTAILEGHTLWDNSVAFSPDGKTLASGEWRTVKLWDMVTKTKIATLEGHTDDVTSVAFSPDGAILASGGQDYTIKLWDMATKTNTATLRGHTDEVNSVAFSTNSAVLASGSDDATIKLWDMATNTKDSHT